MAQSNWYRPTTTRRGHRLFLYLISIASLVGLILLYPTPGQAEGPIKVKGTAEGDITVWIPAETLSYTPLVTADYIAEKDLPGRIKYAPYTVGQAFTLGVWQGDSITFDQFSPSIVINVKYDDEDIQEDQRPNEQQIHLFMYDPTSKSWNKLCSSVDVHENVVSAALAYPTPLDGKGSSLFALAVDQTPPLDQTVDGQGTTTLSVPGSNLELKILRDDVGVGSHFVITVLPNAAGSRSVKLLSRAVDIKACHVDYQRPTENNREIDQFYKRPQVGFSYDADTLSRAGDPDNLTIVNIQKSRWVDVEEIGSRVSRGSKTITVDTDGLGTFGLAVR